MSELNSNGYDLTDPEERKKYYNDQAAADPTGQSEGGWNPETDIPASLAPKAQAAEGALPATVPGQPASPANPSNPPDLDKQTQLESMLESFRKDMERTAGTFGASARDQSMRSDLLRHIETGVALNQQRPGQGMDIDSALAALDAASGTNRLNYATTNSDTGAALAERLGLGSRTPEDRYGRGGDTFKLADKMLGVNEATDKQSHSLDQILHPEKFQAKGVDLTTPSGQMIPGVMQPSGAFNPVSRDQPNNPEQDPYVDYAKQYGVADYRPGDKVMQKLLDEKREADLRGKMGLTAPEKPVDEKTLTSARDRMAKFSNAWKVTAFTDETATDRQARYTSANDLLASGALKGPDAEALAFVRDNPKDPRAQSILLTLQSRLGMENGPGRSSSLTDKLY